MPYFTFSPSEELVGQTVVKVEKDGDWITLTFDNAARALVIRLCDEKESFHKDWEERKRIPKSLSSAKCTSAS